MNFNLKEKFLKWARRDSDPLTEVIPSDRITTDFYHSPLARGFLIRAYAEKTWRGKWNVRLISECPCGMSSERAAWTDAALNENASFTDSGLPTLQAIGRLAIYERNLGGGGRPAVQPGPKDEMKLQEAIDLLRVCDVDMSHIPGIRRFLR